MKLTTKVHAAARNVGDARDSGELFHGELREVIEWLIAKLAKTSMATRIEICLARTQEEAAKSIGKSGGGKMSNLGQFQSLIDSMFADSLDDEDDSDSTFEEHQPDPLDNYVP